MSRAGRLGLALAALLAAAQGARAADWKFEPVLRLGGERSDNIYVMHGEGQTGYLLTADLRLDLAVRGPRSRTSFVYEPMYQRFTHVSGQARESQVNAHYFTAGWSFDVSPRQHWEMTGTFARQERPRLFFETPQNDLIALPGLTDTRWSFGIAGRFRMSETASWYLAPFYARDHFSAEMLDLDGNVVLTRNTTQESTVETGIEVRVSPLNATRYAYRGSRIDEGVRGRRDVHRVLVGYLYGSTETWQVVSNAGYAWVRPAESINGTRVTQAHTEWLVDLTLRRAFARRGAFTLGASHDVTGTSGTVGVAATDSAYTSLDFPLGRFSSLGLGYRWARRAPYEREARPLTTKVARAEWDVAFGPHWGLVLGAERLDQNSSVNDTAGQELPSLKYTIYSLGLRWSPAAHE